MGFGFFEDAGEGGFQKFNDSTCEVLIGGPTWCTPCRATIGEYGHGVQC